MTHGAQWINDCTVSGRNEQINNIHWIFAGEKRIILLHWFMVLFHQQHIHAKIIWMDWTASGWRQTKQSQHQVQLCKQWSSPEIIIMCYYAFEIIIFLVPMGVRWLVGLVRSYVSIFYFVLPLVHGHADTRWGTTRHNRSGMISERMRMCALYHAPIMPNAVGFSVLLLFFQFSLAFDFCYTFGAHKYIYISFSSAFTICV